MRIGTIPLFDPPSIAKLCQLAGKIASLVAIWWDPNTEPGKKRVPSIGWGKKSWLGQHARCSARDASIFWMFGTFLRLQKKSENISKIWAPFLGIQLAPTKNGDVFDMVLVTHRHPMARPTTTRLLRLGGQGVAMEATINGPFIMKVNQL